MWSSLIANDLMENIIPHYGGGCRSPPMKKVEGGTSFYREKIIIREGVRIRWQEIQQQNSICFCYLQEFA